MKSGLRESCGMSSVRRKSWAEVPNPGCSRLLFRLRPLFADLPVLDKEYLFCHGYINVTMT